MQTFRPRAAAAALIAAGLLGTALPAAATSPFSSLFVFGDSLSDNGNLFNAIGAPGAPYVQGRFSNGPVAAEYVAAYLGLTQPGQLVDIAFGGAETGTGPFGIGVLSQVAAFAGALGGNPAPQSGLYMVWAGANDLLGVDLSILGDNAALTTLIGGAVVNLNVAVKGLYDLGARNFLLPTLPNLGATPRLQALGPEAVVAGQVLSQVFNAVLTASYQQLAANLPDEKFYVFDTFTATNAAVATFHSFNGNTTDACVPAGLPNCDGYMFFDDIHPTTLTHALLGQQMAAAVPEPATMLMMAAGVAALLGVGRRRRAEAPARRA